MKRKLRNKVQKTNGKGQIERHSFVISHLSLVILLAVIALAAGCSNAKQKASKETPTFTCPMHPTVISAKPGTCPVCGMDLVRKVKPGEEVEITEDLAKLLKSPNEVVISSVKTTKGQYKTMPISVQAQGVVTYDTRNLYSISSRVSGRIEKVYLKYEFQQVAKGQKVADIYSPELITAQRELLFLLENDSDNKSMIDAAKNKLELSGMSSSQINSLIQKRSVSNVMSVYSSYSGYLINGSSPPPSSSTPPADKMNPSSNNATANSGSTDRLIREGSYASIGQTLFSIVNTSDLRLEFELPETLSGMIRQGDKIQLDLGNGNNQPAAIDFIEPLLANGKGFLKLRVYITKSDLRIGQLVNASITLPTTESLWIPRESVVDLGNEKVVFVKDRGAFKPKKVDTGIVSESLIQIKSGLASSDEFALNAQFLVDSEDFIKTPK